MTAPRDWERELATITSLKDDWQREAARLHEEWLKARRLVLDLEAKAEMDAAEMTARAERAEALLAVSGNDAVEAAASLTNRARAEREAALSRVAELTAEVSRLELLGECCVPLARLAEVEAQAAALRLALEGYMDDPGLARVDAALSTDAGRALAERVAMWRELEVLATRVVECPTDEEHGIFVAIRGVLARLDSLPRGGTR